MDEPMRPVTLQDYKRRMLRVLVHVQQHLDDPLDLGALARVACFSPYHFHRIFRGMVGESVQEHIRRLRLERAAAWLKLTPRPITRIALDSGYESHEAFTRSFRASFGLSPSQFRASRDRRAAAPVPSRLHYLDGETVTRFRTRPARGNPMRVTITRMKPLRVAFMRHVGPYSKVGATWDQLLPQLGKDGWIGGDALFLGICHDDPDVTAPDRIRYDACVTVGADFQPIGDIGVQVVAGGDYAVTIHFGPYTKLGDSYAKLLGQWLPRSGRELRSRPCFETYLNDPNSTDPADLLTDLYAPLEPKSATANPRRSFHPT
jgi:AraC family transcriptional regulator